MKKFKYFLGDYPVYEDDDEEKDENFYGEVPDFSWWWFLLFIPLVIPLIYGIYDFVKH